MTSCLRWGRLSLRLLEFKVANRGKPRRLRAMQPLPYITWSTIWSLLRLWTPDPWLERSFPQMEGWSEHVLWLHIQGMGCAEKSVWSKGWRSRLQLGIVGSSWVSLGSWSLDAQTEVMTGAPNQDFINLHVEHKSFFGWSLYIRHQNATRRSGSARSALPQFDGPGQKSSRRQFIADWRSCNIWLISNRLAAIVSLLRLWHLLSNSALAGILLLENFLVTSICCRVGQCLAYKMIRWIFCMRSCLHHWNKKSYATLQRCWLLNEQPSKVQDTMTADRCHGSSTGGAAAPVAALRLERNRRQCESVFVQGQILWSFGVMAWCCMNGDRPWSPARNVLSCADGLWQS